ncbi:hypothetical protein V6N13_141529 [Hibiscus sabdariffa]|uniref:Uncharacterized protein n=2 Tax=Hibiscus sabdariffa TaxID=183260 RepID=A0ABR2P5K0_9ROSI
MGRVKGFDTKDIDEEDREAYMGVMPLIEKLEERNSKENDILIAFEVPTESGKKQFERKQSMHEQLLNNFSDCEAGATSLLQWKEAYDPDNPANYGVIKAQQVGTSVDRENTTSIHDNILSEKLNAIDKKPEEKLAGKKGKLLEEEIRDLAER